LVLNLIPAVTGLPVPVSSITGKHRQVESLPQLLF